MFSILFPDFVGAAILAIPLSFHGPRHDCTHYYAIVLVFEVRKLSRRVESRISEIGEKMSLALFVKMFVATLMVILDQKRPTLASYYCLAAEKLKDCSVLKTKRYAIQFVSAISSIRANFAFSLFEPSPISVEDDEIRRR